MANQPMVSGYGVGSGSSNTVSGLGVSDFGIDA